ncbi:hypothetical protein [Marinicella litoralis]|uniref:Uncharacterized protein n=2 Tax=Marinicella litoralis TaxID=644220 RepID=A0A4R6XYH4_9GAMM|nr:hypothetical protein [Marinicella litoralis]TDR23570.1 hypothetical protein C8D91_0433 [Marinicella litoralis]
MLLLALLAFWPSFFKPVIQGSFNSPVSLIHWHASFVFLWLLLLMVQPLLISLKRFAYHQILGLLAVLVVIGLVYTGFMVQVKFMQHYFKLNEWVHAVQVPFFRLVTLLVFTVCFILAMLIKDRSWHKRLIFLGSFAILEAAFARLYMNYMGVLELAGLLGALTHIGIMAYFVFWDRIVLGHFHVVSLWGSIIITAFIFGTAPIAETQWWFGVAQSIASLAVE